MKRQTLFCRSSWMDIPYRWQEPAVVMEPFYWEYITFLKIFICCFGSHDLRHPDLSIGIGGGNSWLIMECHCRMPGDKKRIS